MDDRRYQVFVSSTFFDLKEERAAVVAALLQLDAFPAGMELFPAADDDAWTLIKRVIDSSDYYLLVIGGRYGSTDPETELSYTEMEYDYAVANGKPVMAFLHENPDAIEMGKSEKSDEARKKLDGFRRNVESKKHVKFWHSPDDLAGKVALSFANFRNTYPAVGWVRGDVQTSAESLTELNQMRKRLEHAEQQLEAARTTAPPGTERLSQGDEPIEVTPVVEARIRTASSAYGKQWRARIKVTVSWDDIFSAVGPELLDEAEQSRVRRRIDGWLTQRFGSRVRRAARAAAEGEGETVLGLRDTAVSIEDEDFGTIIVQLRALGLIRRSDRRHSVSDKGTYWTLSPYGDDHLTTLRAIRRDSNGEVATEDGEEADEEEEN